MLSTSDVPTFTATLHNQKLNVPALKEFLAADRLLLKLIDGKLPDFDDKGFTRQSIEGDDVTVVVTKQSGKHLVATVFYLPAHNTTESIA